MTDSVDSTGETNGITPVLIKVIFGDDSKINFVFLHKNISPFNEYLQLSFYGEISKIICLLLQNT